MPWGKLEENGVREGFVITLRKYPQGNDLLSCGKQEGIEEERGKPESCFLTCDRQVLK